MRLHARLSRAKRRRTPKSWLAKSWFVGLPDNEATCLTYALASTPMAQAEWIIVGRAGQDAHPRVLTRPSFQNQSDPHGR